MKAVKVGVVNVEAVDAAELIETLMPGPWIFSPLDVVGSPQATHTFNAQIKEDGPLSSFCPRA